jgi:hypothetical protein
VFSPNSDRILPAVGAFANHSNRLQNLSVNSGILAFDVAQDGSYPFGESTESGVRTVLDVNPGIDMTLHLVSVDDSAAD